MNNKKKKLIGKIIAHLILILGSVIMLVPFFWMLSSSLKVWERFLYFRQPCLENGWCGRITHRFPADLITLRIS